MLPSEMKNKIDNNIAYYGTETPDCPKTYSIYCKDDMQVIMYIIIQTERFKLIVGLVEQEKNMI